jgi:hypothetical protein
METFIRLLLRYVLKMDINRSDATITYNLFNNNMFQLQPC